MAHLRWAQHLTRLARHHFLHCTVPLHSGLFAVYRSSCSAERLVERSRSICMARRVGFISFWNFPPSSMRVGLLDRHAISLFLQGLTSVHETHGAKSATRQIHLDVFCLQVGMEGPTTSTGCTLQVNNNVEAFAQCKALTTGLRLLWSLSPDQQVTHAHLTSRYIRTV